MTRRRYDPNPDVDEVLRYSGAGRLRQERQWDRETAIWKEAREKSDARWTAHTVAMRQREKRWALTVALICFLIVGAAIAIRSLP